MKNVNNKKSVVFYVWLVIALVIASVFAFIYAKEQANSDNKADEILKNISGTWHTYLGNKYSEVKIKIHNNILTDNDGDKYKITINPSTNSFTANHKKYVIADDYSYIKNNEDVYTNPRLDPNPEDVINITIQSFDYREGYAKCVGILTNNSRYTYRLLKIKGGFINNSYQLFHDENFDFVDFKPGESKTLVVESDDDFLLNLRNPWMTKDCKFEIEEAKT